MPTDSKEVIAHQSDKQMLPGEKELRGPPASLFDFLYVAAHSVLGAPTPSFDPHRHCKLCINILTYKALI